MVSGCRLHSSGGCFRGIRVMGVLRVRSCHRYYRRCGKATPANPALAGAFLVGVVGAKWITNEADKRLLKESVKVAGTNVRLSKERARR